MARHYNASDTLLDYKIDRLEFNEPAELIGKGANGRILGAKWEGTSVAVKEIHPIFIDDISDVEFGSFRLRFLEECDRSRKLRHPNIVQFLGVYWPPAAGTRRSRLPSLVMERLDCSLTKLLENNGYIPLTTKRSIINDVALGLRYLHSHKPQPIIHRDLSSNNVLVSKRTEGKIGDLGTARFVDPDRKSQMTQTPGTLHFMPPEGVASTGQYGKELDVFSFGCVMLHTFSHCDWPTPLASTYVDSKTQKLTARSEVERRQSYFNKIQHLSELSLIKSCLARNPNERESIVNISDQLQKTRREPLNMLTVQQENFAKNLEIQNKGAEIKRLKDEIQSKDAEIRDNVIIIKEKNNQIKSMSTALQDKEGQIKSQNSTLQCRTVTIRTQDNLLKSKDHEIKRKNRTIQKQKEQIIFKETEMHDLEVNIKKLESEKYMLTSKHVQVNKGSNDFWKKLRVNIKPCTDLPKKCWATSIAELDGNVFITAQDSTAACLTPYVYNFVRKEWSSLPDLPYANASLVSVPGQNQLLAIGGCKKNDENAVEVSRQVFQWDAINKKWISKYPMMPTARFSFSSISHESRVIVAGGVTCYSPWIITRAVEILIIKEGWLPVFRSYWTTVEQLPHAVYDTVPLIVNDSLYIAGGFDKLHHSTCSIVTASLPDLQKSSNNNTNSSQVWNKLPDIPYSSYSISHYQGRLIAFTEVSPAEQSDGGKQMQKIYLYNPDAESWDYINHDQLQSIQGHNWGRSILINDHVIFIVGGTTGTTRKGQDDHLVKTCCMLSFTT